MNTFTDRPNPVKVAPEGKCLTVGMAGAQQTNAGVVSLVA
jgi:hypothetical protein